MCLADRVALDDAHPEARSRSHLTRENRSENASGEAKEPERQTTISMATSRVESPSLKKPPTSVGSRTGRVSTRETRTKTIQPEPQRESA